MVEAIIAAIAAIAGTLISGGVGAANTRRAGEKAEQIANLNFQEQKKQERIATQNSRDVNAETARMNEIQMAIQRKDRETQATAARANAAIAMLNNKNNLQGRVSTLNFGGR